MLLYSDVMFYHLLKFPKEYCDASIGYLFFNDFYV